MLFTAIVIAFAFLAQSLLGFGGGLISIPILCLFMPVQDAVSMALIYQFSMGLLIFKTYKEINWSVITKMIPAIIIGAFCGILLLKYLNGDVVRGVLAAYIILDLLRKHTRFNLIGGAIDRGGVYLSGFLGGLFNSMIGGGAPAYVLYLKSKIKDQKSFRASIMVVLMVSNVPRVIGTFGMGMMSTDLFITGLYAYPGFLLALYLGQKYHDRVPHDKFFIAVEVLLACSAFLLIVKIII